MNRELLAAFDEQLQKLIVLLPGVHRTVRNLAPIENDPRWRKLRENAAALRKLPLVTLVGPTGSGKSTLFRLLSGINVPRGGAKKPNTHNSAVAVPRGISEPELREMFTESQLRPLEDLSELRDPRVSRETLFYCTMSLEAAARGDFLLCDVPDINTICMENWEKAKLMLGRSEVVIFVVHKIAYANYETMFYLARTCAHAAHLAYLITMAKRDEACEIHADLVERKSLEFHLKNADLDEDEAQPFAAPRADGQPRGEFLAQADYYFSEERKDPDQPQLEEIYALADGAPPLADLLRGRNIAQLMLTKRANDIQQGLSLADVTLAAHEKQLSDLQRCRAIMLAQLEDKTLDVVGAQVPLGEVLQIAIREAQSALPPWRRRVSVWLNAPLNIVRRIPEWIGKLKGFFSKAENVQPFCRDVVEAEALQQHAEHLAVRWRADHSHVVRLLEESCTAAIRNLVGPPIPKPDAEWDEYAARRAREWVQEKPGKAALLLTGNGLAGLALPVVVTADIVHTGGLFTIKMSSLGSISGAGAGALAGGALIQKLIESLGMKSLVLDFQNEWKHRRNLQLRSHLREHFARPLVLDTLDQRITALTKAGTAECAQAVAALRRLLAENLPASIT